jgi:ABC-type Fe3+ transport system substrate-binding protein
MYVARWFVYTIAAAIGWLLPAFVPTATIAAQAGQAPTLETILQGAKQEGKLSWTSNLEEHEVRELNKAFQQQYPFITSINYKRVMGGDQQQRVMSEMQAGIFPYDLMSVESEVVDDFQKMGAIGGAVDWQRLFGVDARMVHPQGFSVSVGNNPAVIYYNKNLVPKERIPKTWADCYNPYFMGKVILDVRPVHMLSLIPAYGEEWVIDYARKLLANKPKWMRGNSLGTTMVAAGEVPLSCPASHGSWYRASLGKTNYPVGVVFPEGPVVASRELMMTPIKGAPNPNAAVLMTGWIARTGVKYLHTGRESIFHPESELGAEIKKMKREIKVTSWDMAVRADDYMRKILEVWGFPKPERTGG